jgi:hypothetical protein
MVQAVIECKQYMSMHIFMKEHYQCTIFQHSTHFVLNGVAYDDLTENSA